MTTPDKAARRLPPAKLVSLLAAGATSLWLAAAPAHAQGFYYPQPVIGPQAVTGLLHRQGFRRLTLPVLNRDVYVLDGIDPYGYPMRIIVNAFDGRIVAAHPQRGRGSIQIDPDEDDGFIPPPRRRDWAERAPPPWPGEVQPPGMDAEPQPGIRRVPPPPRAPSQALPQPPGEKAAPQPTPKAPTVVKRSPTAIPRDGASTSDAPGNLAPTPGMGTRDKPRVIELAPKQPDPPQSAPPTAAAPTPALPTAPRPDVAPAPPAPAPATRPTEPPAPQAAAPVPQPLPANPPPAVQKAPDTGQAIKDYRTVPPAILD